MIFFVSACCRWCAAARVDLLEAYVETYDIGVDLSFCLLFGFSNDV